MFFFFKQKTAYEMRSSDWSSDVCSSDLFIAALQRAQVLRIGRRNIHRHVVGVRIHAFQSQQIIVGGALDGRIGVLADVQPRSEARRVGKECVSTCRSRWSPDHLQKNNKRIHITKTEIYECTNIYI